MPRYQLPPLTAASVCTVADARDTERTSAALSCVMLKVEHRSVTIAATDGRVLAEHTIPLDNPHGEDAELPPALLLAWGNAETVKAWKEACKACKPTKGKASGAPLMIDYDPARPSSLILHLPNGAALPTRVLTDATFPPYAQAWGWAEQAGNPGVIPHWTTGALLAKIPGLIGADKAPDAIAGRYNPSRNATVYEPTCEAMGLPRPDGVQRRALLMGCTPTGRDADAHAQAQGQSRQRTENQVAIDGVKRQLAKVAQLIETAMKSGETHPDVMLAELASAAKLARGPWAGAI
jgi:hypothetical protein